MGVAPCGPVQLLLASAAHHSRLKDKPRSNTPLVKHYTPGQTHTPGRTHTHTPWANQPGPTHLHPLPCRVDHLSPVGSGGGTDGQARHLANSSTWDTTQHSTARHNTARQKMSAPRADTLLCGTLLAGFRNCTKESILTPWKTTPPSPLYMQFAAPRPMPAHISPQHSLPPPTCEAVHAVCRHLECQLASVQHCTLEGV